MKPLTRYNHLKYNESEGYTELLININNMKSQPNQLTIAPYIKSLEEAAILIEAEILGLKEELEIANENIESYKQSYQ